MFVRATGYGLVTADGEDFNEAKQDGKGLPEIALPQAAPIKGRLMDAEGLPAIGVRVRPYRVLQYGTERHRSLAQAAEEAKWVGDLADAGSSVMYVDPSSEPLLPWVETDFSGSFTINSVAPDCLVGLFAISERTAAETILVRTDDGPTLTLRYERGKSPVPVHACDGFEHHLSASGPVVGTVRQTLDAAPVPGATVGTWRAPGFSFYRANELMFTQTDAAGKYTLIGLTPGEHRVFALPPEDRAMVPVERRPEVVLNAASVEVDFSMPTGVTITGKVTDRLTGEPVRGQVEAYVFNDNRHLKRLGPTALSNDYQSAPVNEQGEFRIQSLPGPGIVAFRAETQVGDRYRRGGGWEAIQHHRYRERAEYTIFRTHPGYLTAWNFHQLVEINPPEVAPQHAVDITVGEERIDVPLEIVRQPGGPTQVYYSNESSDRGPFSLLTFDLSKQRLQEGVIRFFPGESGRVTQARSRDHGLAGWTYVESTDESAMIRLELSSTIRGRVLSADGTPLADARLMTPPNYDPSRKQALLPSQPDEGYNPHTDDEGRFRLVGLPPGLPLSVVISRYDRSRTQLLSRYYLVEGLLLKPGEDRDLGDIRLDQLRKYDSQ